MTNKEAIEILLKQVDGIPSDVWDGDCDKFADAVQIAIKALEFVEEYFPNTFIDYLNGVKM